jgi:hypothetical protein
MLLNHAVTLAPFVQLRQQANLNAGALWRQPRPAQQAVLVHTDEYGVAALTKYPNQATTLCAHHFHQFSSFMEDSDPLTATGYLGESHVFWPFGGLRTNRRHNLAGVCR